MPCLSGFSHVHIHKCLISMFMYCVHALVWNVHMHLCAICTIHTHHTKDIRHLWHMCVYRHINPHAPIYATTITCTYSKVGEESFSRTKSVSLPCHHYTSHRLAGILFMCIGTVVEDNPSEVSCSRTVFR